jgi:hypothetical protein
MKPGDFFLLHEEDVESRIIQFGTASHWNHAGFIIDENGGTLEALSTGIVSLNVDRFKEGSYEIVDTQLPDATRESVIAWAKTCLGDGYDWLDIIGIGADTLMHAKIVLGTAAHFICSAYVAQGYVLNGVIVPPGYDVRIISPGGLAAWWKCLVR